MPADRPVDAVFPRPIGFRHSRRDALRLGCCARCGLDVDPSALTDIDAREYAISAICPDCWTAVMGEEECE